eukprot:COSAG06_NODE_20588_length_789_cov_1.026087_1_plen_144_part_00
MQLALLSAVTYWIANRVASLLSHLAAAAEVLQSKTKTTLEAQQRASKQASKVTQFTAGSRKQRLDHPVIIAVVVATAVAHLWVVAMVVVGEVAGTAVAVATAGNRHARPHGAGRRGARVDEHRLGHRYAAAVLIRSGDTYTIA